MPAEITKPDYLGACLCGGVQWTSSESPTLQFNCYCVDCRTSTGAAFVPIMFFKTESVTLSGDLTRFSSPGGPSKTVGVPALNGRGQFGASSNVDGESAALKECLIP